MATRSRIVWWEPFSILHSFIMHIRGDHYFNSLMQVSIKKRSTQTSSSKKNQAYLYAFSLQTPVLTTICRASSSWNCCRRQNTQSGVRESLPSVGNVIKVLYVLNWMSLWIHFETLGWALNRRDNQSDHSTVVVSVTLPPCGKGGNCRLKGYYNSKQCAAWVCAWSYQKEEAFIWGVASTVE